MGHAAHMQHSLETTRQKTIIQRMPGVYLPVAAQRHQLPLSHAELVSLACATLSMEWIMRFADRELSRSLALALTGCRCLSPGEQAASSIYLRLRNVQLAFGCVQKRTRVSEAL